MISKNVLTKSFADVRITVNLTHETGFDGIEVSIQWRTAQNRIRNALGKMKR